MVMFVFMLPGLSSRSQGLRLKHDEKERLAVASPRFAARLLLRALSSFSIYAIYSLFLLYIFMSKTHCVS